MKLRRVRVWLFLAVAVGVAQLARAQVGGGEITGLVADATGSATPGATVTATNGSTGAARIVVTNASGLYTLPALPPGVYAVDVMRSGFRSVRHEQVRVETGMTIRLDVTLTVGGVNEAITVTAATTALRASASLGQVVSEQKLTALPLNGRSFVTLISLVPAVAVPPGQAFPRINGGRPRTNEYLFDGISVLQPEPGQVAFFPVVDAIQEFKVETNSPPAEFGRFNGGVINLTTKSGTNALHGTGFEFFRHESLNARNFFATANATTPQFSRNQFGGVLGGPLLRNRTFFFVDYQGQRQDIERTVLSNVPTMAQRQGVFTQNIYDPATTTSNGAGGFARAQFPGNAIPIERMDPIARALLLRFPEPTSAGTANNYRRTASEIDDQNQWDVRLDHVLAS